MNIKDITWKHGQQCNGSYCGVKFEGTIRTEGKYCTRATSDSRGIIFVIDLTNNITVFNQERYMLEFYCKSDDTISKNKDSVEIISVDGDYLNILTKG